jgi:mono/diheme cytochrome c family protein
MRNSRFLLAVLGVAALILSVTGGAASAQSDVDDPAEVEAGRMVYEANCSGCHGAEGQGSDVGRSLTDIATQGERSRHIETVTNGRNTMPAFGGSLDETEVSAVVSFVRLEFATPQEAELAVTGTHSTPLAFAGLALLLAGFGAHALGRRWSVDPA